MVANKDAKSCKNFMNINKFSKIMEQKYKIINETMEFCFKQIKDAGETLKEIRLACDHPEEYYKKVNYSTRPGQNWENTIICGICGELLFGLTHFKESNNFEQP